MRVTMAVLTILALLSGCSDGDGESGAEAEPPATTTTTVIEATPGAVGIGDELFPEAGNGGYDVEAYDLDFDMTAPDGTVVATAGIEATATQDLSSFHLDFRGYDVESVTLDGAPVAHRRDFDELVVEPADPVAEGDSFTVEVGYRGVPPGFTEPPGAIATGWLRAPSGSFTVMEPVSARTMFPANDHPADKAEFTITVRAPDGETVLANGTEVARRDAGPAEVVTFDVGEPMAPYLVQVAVGDYTTAETEGPDGVALRSAVAAGAPVTAADLNASAARQLPWFTERFGAYPFDTYGLLVADAPPTLALETQTLSIFPASWFSAGIAPVDAIAAHELAHQWFGDHVALEQWSDMWLKEGLATYIQWMWDDHVGNRTLGDAVAEATEQAQGWRDDFGPVGEPDVAGLYSDNVYDGGALVYAALRSTIGDDAFFELLTEWVARYGGGSASDEEFEALAAEVSGQDLDDFFDGWLRSTTLPATGT